MTKDISELVSSAWQNAIINGYDFHDMNVEDIASDMDLYDADIGEWVGDSLERFQELIEVVQVLLHRVAIH